MFVVQHLLLINITKRLKQKFVEIASNDVDTIKVKLTQLLTYMTEDIDGCEIEKTH